MTISEFIRPLTVCVFTAFFGVLICSGPSFGVGEPESTQEIMQAVLSSFSLPIRDLMEKEHGSEWDNIFTGFSGNFIFTCPLKDTEAESRGTAMTQAEGFRKATVAATIKYNPLSYWFAAVTFVGYLNFESGSIWNPDSKAPWDPDFTYVFGYDDWHPYTFSLVYSNYGGNRINPDRGKGEKRSTFSEGTISLGWKFPFPRNLEYLFIVHPTGGINGAINLNLTPEYSDLATLSDQTWKTSLSLSLKYTIYKWWYANATFYYYPDLVQQQPWDPDFTYGFGYFDWHASTISVQYNNHAGNRYPWNKSDAAAGFKDGSVSISWSWVF